jgi:F420-dependent oxidoreductase-like protein
MDIAIMIEGQHGLNWPRWKRVARAVEDFGFAGLYRSDHFTNPSPPDLDALELWVSLTWLASHTKQIEFGPLVSPVSFRDPVFTARIAKDIDDLSGGRLTLGVGAGWQEREHTMFGYDLLDVPERFARFAEGLEVITALLREPEPVEIAGDYYRLRQATLLPRPKRSSGPPLLIGGNGPKRTLPLVAQYANEWNGVFLSPARFVDLCERLDLLLLQCGRQPEDVRRSVMTGLKFGRTELALSEQLDGQTAAEVRERGLVVGTPTQVADQVADYAEVGVSRLMLQWMDLDDLHALEALAKTLL